MTKNSLEFTTKFGGHAYFSSLGLNRQKKKNPHPKRGNDLGEDSANAWFRKFSITVMQSALVISWTRTS